jgi:hypothetical protein
MKGNNMRGKQSGMSIVAFIITLIVVCFFAFTGMVIGPAYSEYFGVKKAMNFVSQNTSPDFSDQGAVVKMLEKQFNVGYVDNVNAGDVKLITKKGGNQILMDYEVRKPFIYNIDFAIKFKYQVPLGGKSSGD